MQDQDKPEPRSFEQAVPKIEMKLPDISEARKILKAHGIRVPENAGEDALLSVSLIEAAAVLASTTQEIAAMRIEMKKLEDNALTDPRTGLNNSRAFYEEVGRMISRRTEESNTDGTDKRVQSRVSKAFPNSYIVMFDIDKMKELNAKFGHGTTDMGIKAIADVIKKNAGERHFAARHGGDEFVVILYDVRERDAKAFAERVERQVKSLKLVEPTLDGVEEKMPLTLTTGYSRINADAHRGKQPQEAARAMIQEADSKLMEKKSLRDAQEKKGTDDAKSVTERSILDHVKRPTDDDTPPLP